MAEHPAQEAPLRLESLKPPHGALTVAEAIESFDLSAPPGTGDGRPRVLLNMVSTLDGRASLSGRSARVSGPADRALFHGLRSAVDGVLVGAGTVRAERYGRMISALETREARLRRGLPAEPLACVVSGRLVLEADIPLLGEPEAHVVLITSSEASLPESSGPAARVDYIRAGGGGEIDLHMALDELGKRFRIRTLLCEGGPHLARQMISAGLIDELFLSLSPTLAAGEPAAGEALRILAGAELDPPVGLELLGVLSSDSYLFLRYGVSAPERVSRETTSSSSLAR
jgi:riboflavin-specific deaminase-like protein